MPEYIEQLLVQYRSKGILIDSNLLLLYFIGSYDPEQIGKFKRTITFTVEDFQRLEKLISYFETVVTTPNVLTEVSNLSNQLPQQVKKTYFQVFSQLTSNLQETYHPSEEICALPHFHRFGLTDSGIIDLAPERYLVLTDDFPLANYLQSANVDVINFNHIRTLNWR